MLSVFKKRQKSLFLTTSVLLIFGLTALLGPATITTPTLGAQTPEYGGEVFIGMSDDPDTLNPITYTTLYASYVNAPLFDSLVDLDWNSEPYAHLAKEIPTGVIGEDSWSVIFEIRDGVTWHDGTPFTAYDVEWTFGQLTDPEIGPTISNYVDLVEYDDDWETQDLVVTAIDDTHVKMETRLWNADTSDWEPYEFAPFFLQGPGGIPILPKHLLEASDDWREDPWNDAPIGTGAYMFDSGESRNFWRIVRNPNYYMDDAAGNQLPYLDAVTFKVYSSDEAMMAAYLNQEIDIHGFQLDLDDREALAETAEELGLDIQIMSRPDDGFRFVNYNTKSVCVPAPDAESTTCKDAGMTPLDDKLVRQALTLAVDKEDIRARHYGGEGIATPSLMIPFNSWAYNYDPALDEYIRYDPEAAAALLDEAGYTASYEYEDPFYGPTQLRFDGWDLRVLVGSHDVNRYQSAITIAQFWGEIGVRAHVVTTSFNLILLDVYDAGNFESYVGGYGNMGIDADWLYSLLGSQAIFRVVNNDLADDGDNMGEWSNAEFDDLGFRARSTTDMTVRADLYREMQVLLAEEQPAYNYYVSDVWQTHYSMFVIPEPGTGLGGIWDSGALRTMWFTGGEPVTKTIEPTTTVGPTTTTAVVTSVVTQTVPEWTSVSTILALIGSGAPVLVLIHKRKKRS